MKRDAESHASRGQAEARAGRGPQHRRAARLPAREAARGAQGQAQRLRQVGPEGGHRQGQRGQEGGRRRPRSSGHRRAPAGQPGDGRAPLRRPPGRPGRRPGAGRRPAGAPVGRGAVDAEARGRHRRRVRGEEVIAGQRRAKQSVGSACGPEVLDGTGSHEPSATRAARGRGDGHHGISIRSS